MLGINLGHNLLCHAIPVHSIEMAKKVVEKEIQQVSLSTVSSPLSSPLHAYRRQTCSGSFTIGPLFSFCYHRATRRTLLEEHAKEIQQVSLSTGCCPLDGLHRQQTCTSRFTVQHRFCPSMITGQLECTLLEELQ